MSKERFCRVCSGWHGIDAWPHNCLPEAAPVPTLSAPMIRSDCMDAIQGQHDGKMYDSKSALRASYKAAGVVEVGNDSSIVAPKPRKLPKPDKKGIKEAVGKAFSRVGISV